MRNTLLFCVVVLGVAGGAAPAMAVEAVSSPVRAFEAHSLDVAALSAEDLVELAAVTKGNEGRPAKYRALHAAAFHDMADWASALLDRGTDINSRDDVGRTALMIAASFGSDKVIAMLLARGADTMARDAVRGDTALHYAALTGHKEATRLLLAAHVDPAVRATHNGETPLHYAALRGQIGVIDLLVGAGTDVNVADNTGVRPIQYAKLRLRWVAAKRLEDLGAQPDTLADAVNAGDIASVQAILASGVDVDEPDLFGTALHRVAATGRVYVAGMLLDHGASIEAPGDLFEGHPLHVAALHNQAGVAAFLLDRGAEVDARDSQGRTPLTIAAEFGSADVATVLLAHGADPRAQDSVYRDTPIHCAALAGNTAIVKLLLSHGVDVDLRSGHDGESALIYAAAIGKVEMVAFLLERGADVNLTDNTGRTPIQSAMSHGKGLLAVELLKTYGPKN